MKILIATTYIYDPKKSEFTRNKTGFGMMVNDIFTSLSEKEEVYFISHVITRGYGASIMRHTLSDVLRNAKLKDWFQGIKWGVTYNQEIKGRIQYLFYCVNKGYVRKIIKQLEPDVVHIHGIGLSTKTYIEVCEELKVSYVVTLHGLIGLNETVRAKSWDKAYEKEFLIIADKKGIPVTVISTGMKKRIEKEYIGHEAKNITVVTNGTKIPYGDHKIDKTINLRKMYSVPKGWKVGLVIGSICERKNQVQIVDALANLKTNGRLNSVVFFCGTDTTNGTFKKKIEDQGLQGCAVVLGFIEHDILNELMNQADFNIVASKDEGFGLSIIEAYAHGLPTVAFHDIDSIEDLYDEQGMVLSEERSTASLANAIYSAVNREWESEKIKTFSMKFSLEKMTEQYEQEYRSILRSAEGAPVISDI